MLRLCGIEITAAKMINNLTQSQKLVLSYIQKNGGEIIGNLGCQTTMIDLTVEGSTLPAAQVSWRVAHPLIRAGAIECVSEIAAGTTCALRTRALACWHKVTWSPVT
ncbi:MAG: hypothetical protein ACXWF8_17505 [Methylobacter sp.]